mmetsp:Transcript_10837/g.33235  ORF Transcript_10837/g.33235 Transcript_10837/m.33235 type:complete len:464 (+) Transcript_10837:129-1520(+)|eukprot:CAMPEP_0198732532 /NCGR_PEP_ID=MMETSP1475-20131203/36512_1 /TAXON_ID= ORGANISM="Unidentified sp., Strain CCMP1999" /NCGR_SAMPLE_ID=MMETSP1475 /ASSEMBLY_ACC=CAM_ASM_001111 /LENGTH=463 /DNA_ID=CAMNT_0044495669 /DNA_START=99 /DNA_END=1490 /DNA_ORIENTATION=+
MSAFVVGVGTGGRASRTVPPTICVKPVVGRTAMTLARETDTHRKSGRGQRRWRRGKSAAQQLAGEEKRKQQKHVERRKEVAINPETKLVRMLDYLRSLGLSIEDSGRVVQRRPQLVNLDIRRDVEPILQLLHASPFCLSEKQVARAIRNGPQLFFKSRSVFESRVQLLSELGVEGDALATVVSQRPHTLWMDIANAKRVIKYVREEVGVEEERSLTKFFSTVPQTLLEPPGRLQQTVDWLVNEAGLARDKVAKVCAKWPQLFAYKPDTTLSKRLQFLRNVGLQKSTIVKVIEASPNVTAMSIPAQLQKHLDKLNDLGMTKEQVDSVICCFPGFFTAHVDPRLDFLRDIGADNDLVSKIVCSNAGILFASVDSNLKPKWKYMCDTVGGSLDDIRELPTYFGYNLEERIMPRFAFCCARGIKASVKEMIGNSDEQFCRQVAKVSYEEYREFESHGQWMLFSTPIL